MFFRKQLVLTTILFISVFLYQFQSAVSQEVDGISYIYDSKNKVHIIKIDLTNPHIRLRTVLANDTAKSTEQVAQMAKRYNAIVAINGDYFGNTGPVLVEGTTYVDGVKIWESPYRTYLAISRNNQAAVVRQGERPNFDVYNAIGGGPWIIWNGEEEWDRTTVSNCPGQKSVINGECYANSLYWDNGGRPQSAIGITQDGRTLILAVATASSPKKIAKILVKYGAWTAMKLDSGGSSTLYYNGHILHTENRPVANALVVVHDRIQGQPPTLNPPPTSPSCKASPKISVKPKSGFPGTPFTVKWKGFSDNGTLISHLQKPDGTEYPTKTFTVDRKGKAEFVIDSSTFTPGQYNLWAEDTCTGKRTETVSFTIKGSTSPPIVQPPPTCPPGTTGTPPNCISIPPKPSQNFILTVNVFGNGSVISVTDEGINCGSDCQQDYPSGTIVVLLALPVPGAVFRGWSIGDCTTNLCTITMDFPVTISAIFSEDSSTPQPSPPPSQPIDSDNDGIPDNQDQCPYQWGPAPTGCPAATQPSPPSSNQPPWAQIEVFPRTVNVGEFVTIQVISYGDPEGQPLAFDYDFGDGTVIPSPAAGERHRYSQPGTYTVRAKVRDPQGAFSYTNSISVTVIGPSSPPPSLPLIDSDDDGIPDNQDQCPYEWGPPPLGCPITTQPPSSPILQSPIAQFTMSADGQTAFENEILWLEVLAGTTVTVMFSASRSFDPDGTIVSYQWFINGTPVSQSRDFSFDLGANAPQHLIHLIITDDDGQQAEVGATIIVEEIIGLDEPPWFFGLKNNIGFTSVQIYSAQGKLIYQLEEIPPYRHWQWDMKDRYGTHVPNGVYLAVITVRDLSGYPIRREVKKIVVLR